MLLNDAMTTMPTQSRGHGTRAPGVVLTKRICPLKKNRCVPFVFSPRSVVWAAGCRHRSGRGMTPNVDP